MREEGRLGETRDTCLGVEEAQARDGAADGQVVPKQEERQVHVVLCLS